MSPPRSTPATTTCFGLIGSLLPRRAPPRSSVARRSREFHSTFVEGERGKVVPCHGVAIPRRRTGIELAQRGKRCTGFGGRSGALGAFKPVTRAFVGSASRAPKRSQKLSLAPAVHHPIACQRP